MKKFFKKVLLRLFHPFALRLGYAKPNKKGYSYAKDSLLDNFYSVLIKVNFIPQHIVDVGANHGTWTRATLEYFPDASYTLLEPQSWMRESIEDLMEIKKKISFYGIGAGKKKGSFKFTLVDRDDSCTFSYSEADAVASGFNQIDVEVVTLNDFLPNANPLIPDIVKIDAEGLDIDVLMGASNYFGKTEVFMVEVGIVYKGFNNSFLNVIKYMDENGYRLFDITDLNRPFATRVLWLAELVFIKKNGVIDSKSFVY
jgi:FkbM family methyltransferase